MTEADVCLQCDHTLRLIIRLTGNVDGTKGSGAVKVDKKAFGNKQLQLAEGAVDFDLTALRNLLAAGQVDGEFSEGAVCFAASQKRQHNGMSILSKGEIGFKGINVGFEIAACLFAVVQLDTVAGNCKFRLFRLAQGIHQQAQTEDHDDDREDQLVADVKLPKPRLSIRKYPPNREQPMLKKENLENSPLTP